MRYLLVAALLLGACTTAESKPPKIPTAEPVGSTGCKADDARAVLAQLQDQDALEYAMDNALTSYLTGETITVRANLQIERDEFAERNFPQCGVGIRTAILEAYDSMNAALTEIGNSGSDDVIATHLENASASVVRASESIQTINP